MQRIEKYDEQRSAKLDKHEKSGNQLQVLHKIMNSLL